MAYIQVMLGLVPSIPVGAGLGMGRFETVAVYIVTDRRYGVLYTGVTAYFVKRISQHRAGEGGKFTTQYNCNRLVW